MIFFAGNDGTVTNSIPSPVYQGSAGANDIYLVAPFAVNLQATVAFKLPNGVWTERYLMTQIAELKGAVNEQTGKPYIGWRFSLPNEITQYYGTVTAQFFFYTGNSGVITATSAASFMVGKGVPEVLPAKPTEDIYNQIIDNLSALSGQVENGTFAARAIYAWNSTYKYGANEIVYYPNEGELGVFLKSLTPNNNYSPYEGEILNAKHWRVVTDFNILERITHLQTEIEQAVLSAGESATAANQSANTATEQATAAEQSATNAESAAQRVESAESYLKGVQNGETAVTKAIGDGNGENIAEQFANINEKIPSTASAENQLADKAFVNSSINNMAAFFITYNSQGNAFPSHASLIAANTFYSGGKVRVPTQNDYAIVLADETQPKGVDDSYPTTRYVYQTANAGGTYPDGQWEFQYVVNNTSLTQAQVDAINSGITKELVDTIGKGNVLSVNGQTGNVTITPSNIGALSIRQIEGAVQDYVFFVVPLIDITNDVIGAERYFDGIICIYRDNGVNRGVVAEAHLKKKYNAVDAYSAFIQFQIPDGTTHAIVKFSKGGRTYIGARYEITASATGSSKFVYGKWSNDTETRGFPIWSYYNTQSGDIIDAEIYNSMVDWVENNISIGALTVRSQSSALTISQDNNYSGMRFMFADGYYSLIVNEPNNHKLQYILRNPAGDNRRIIEFPSITGSGTLALKGTVIENGNEVAYISNDGFKLIAGQATFTPSSNGEYTITYRTTTFISASTCFPVISCRDWYDSTYACQIGVTNVSSNGFSFKLAGSTIKNINYIVFGQ